MALPGSPAASVPPGEDWLVRRVADLERRLNELAAADPLRTAGIQVTGPDSLTLDGDVDVTGDMDVTGAMNIMGPLTLNPGSIPNDALLSPIISTRGFGNGDSFTVTTTDSNVASFNMTVPAGYTKATITGLACIFVTNPTPNVDYLYTRLYIDSPAGNTWGRTLLSLMGPNNGSAALTVICTASLSGLSAGQTITVRQTARTQIQTMSFAANGATAEALFQFTR